MPETIIALSYRVGGFFMPYFEEVTLVRELYNPYSENEEALYQRIYVCKKPTQDFDAMKELFKHRIFEGNMSAARRHSRHTHRFIASRTARMFTRPAPREGCGGEVPQAPAGG